MSSSSECSPTRRAVRPRAAPRMAGCHSRASSERPPATPPSSSRCSTRTSRETGCGCHDLGWRRAESGKRLGEVTQVAIERGGRIWIEHQAFIARRRPLHFHRGGLSGKLAIEQRQGARAIGGAHGRAAERPAGAGGHVDSESETPGFARGVAEHLHPLRRQKIEVARLAAERAVDGRDLDAADTRSGDGLELRRDVLAIDRASRPPPASPGLCGLRSRRPRPKARPDSPAQRPAMSKARGSDSPSDFIARP